MINNKRFVIIIFIILLPTLIFSQLKPAFKIGTHDVGIHGLNESECFLSSPSGDKLIILSYTSSCISVLKYDFYKGEWYHFQTVFMDDYGYEASLYFTAALSPSGKDLYVSADKDNQSILQFVFNEVTDSLELNSILSGISSNQYGSIQHIDVCNNSKLLYVSSWKYILCYTRDLVTGELVFSSGMALDDYTSYDMKISPDSKNLYVLPDNSFLYDYFRTYSIDEITGNLTLIQQIEYTPENNWLALYDSRGFDIDPLGEYVYIISDELSIFARNSSDGTLTFIANQENLGKPDVVDNKLRDLRKVYVDKVNNQQVHLFSGRDGWIIMDKNPQTDTLVFNRFIAGEALASFGLSKNLISVDTSLFIISYNDNTLKKYCYSPGQDTVLFRQIIYAWQNALYLPKSLLMTPEEDIMYVLSRETLSKFKRNVQTGTLDFTGTIEFAKSLELSDFCMSPSGSYIYIASGYLSIYKTKEGDTMPELVQVVEDDHNLQLVRISDDCKNLYVSRNSYNGELWTYEINNDATVSLIDTIQFEETISDMCLNKDSRFLYTVSTNDHKLRVYSRNPETGFLTEIQDIIGSNFSNGNLCYVTKIKVNNDERFVYTGSYERTIGLLELDTLTGLLTMTGQAGSKLAQETYKPQTLTISHDDRYFYVTHNWWEHIMFVFSRDLETGKLTELKTYHDGDPELQIYGSREMISDKKDRFMYSVGQQFVACFHIDPIIEDTIKHYPGEETEIYANPFYQNYQWSASLLNQNSITTNENGWVYLTAVDEYNGLRHDSVYIDDSSDMTNAPANKGYFTIYPNPVRNILFIRNNEATVEVNLQIVDLIGREIKTLRIDFSAEIETIDISDLKKDVYLLKISRTSNSEILDRQIFVKQ